jgi:hypothetical protein
MYADGYEGLRKNPRVIFEDEAAVNTPLEAILQSRSGGGVINFHGCACKLQLLRL